MEKPTSVSKVEIFNKMAQLAKQENKLEATPQELARQELLGIINCTLKEETAEKKYLTHINITQEQIQRLMS